MSQKMTQDEIAAMLYGMYPQVGLATWRDYNTYAEANQHWQHGRHYGQCQGKMDVECMRCRIEGYMKLACMVADAIEKFVQKNKEASVGKIFGHWGPEERREIIRGIVGKHLGMIGYKRA